MPIKIPKSYTKYKKYRIVLCRRQPRLRQIFEGNDMPSEPKRFTTRSGPRTKWAAGLTVTPCYTSTYSCCTKSPRRKRLRVCSWPAARCGVSMPTWQRQITMCQPGRELGLAGISDEVALEQVVTLDKNCKSFGVQQFEILDPRQGIVHVVGPEQGATMPGMTVVCGDSHTSTHGAFAALAQGIGTSEVEHVMATQCLVQNKAKNFAVNVTGSLADGVTAKDLVLAIIGRLGTAGATGHTIEYRGEAIRQLSMEGRMTLCNMSIEAGARAGLVAVDDTTINYLHGRPFAPKGELWNQAENYWRLSFG